MMEWHLRETTDQTRVSLPTLRRTTRKTPGDQAPETEDQGPGLVVAEDAWVAGLDHDQETTEEEAGAVTEDAAEAVTEEIETETEAEIERGESEREKEETENGEERKESERTGGEERKKGKERGKRKWQEN